MSRHGKELRGASKMRGPSSGVASSKFLGANIFDFKRITLFCLEKRFSMDEMTIFSEIGGGHGPFDSLLGTPMGHSSWLIWPLHKYVTGYRPLLGNYSA